MQQLKLKQVLDLYQIYKTGINLRLFNITLLGWFVP